MRPTHRSPVLVCSLLIACGDDTGTARTDTADTAPRDVALGDEATTGDVPVVTPPIEVTFGDACRGGAELRWDCGTATVPLDWDDPDGPTLTLSVLRRLAAPPARGQLWILPGGPGYTAFAYKGAGDTFAGRLGDLDVYLVDHRGVGDATRLACPARAPGDAFVAWAVECAAALRATWSDDELAGFSSDAAGRDVAALVTALRPPGGEVYLLGPSYGTRWALRALEHLPVPPTGVVLDSILPDDATYLDLARAVDETARALFDACGADAECGARLGADPWTALADLIVDLDAGTCPTERGLDRRAHVDALATLVASSARALAPALVHRLARCRPDDEAAILHLIDTLGGAVAADVFGEPLNMHVLASELWPATLPSAGEVATAEAALRTGSGRAGLLRDAAAAWPRYIRTAPDPIRTDVPVLAVNRTHDPATAIAGARRVAALLTGPDQHFVEIAGFGHTASESLCASELILAFLANPYLAPDTRCATASDALRFAGTVFEAQANALFDDSAWGDEEPR